MSDQSQGVDWWLASDGKWYPPQSAALPPPPPTTYYAPAPLAQQSTNGFAIASMVLGILWLYWIGSILALVFGYKARKEIDASNGAQGGRGMATAGIVLGWIGVAGTGVFVLLIVVIRLLGQDATVNFSSTGSSIN